MTFKLNSKVQKQIRTLVDEVRGNNDLKRLVFEQFKLLGLQRKEQAVQLIQAKHHMKQWKLYICFKSWQNLKRIENAQIDKENKIIELLAKRKKYRMFYYFKVGIVYNRISYIDHKLINIVHTQVLKSKLLLEWLRNIHLDKSIKTKVAQMLNNTSTGLNTSFVNMSKMQIDEYFTDRIKEAKEKLTEDLVNLKLERSHYKYFIKQEFNLMKSKIEHKYPLKLKLENIKFLLNFNTSKKNTDEDIF